MLQNKNSRLLVSDYLILNACFLFMHQLSGVHGPWRSYGKLWLMINVIWAAVSVWNKKNEHWRCQSLVGCMRFIGVNALYMLYATAVIAVFLGVTGFTRFHIIGTYLLYFLVLSLTVTIVFILKRKESDSLTVTYRPQTRPFARHWLELFFIDLFLLGLSYFVVHYFKYGTIIPVDNAKDVPLILSAVWLITSLFTDKFKKAQDRNVLYAASPFVKSYIIGSALMSVVVYALRLFRYSRTLVFGSLLLLLLFELAIVLLRIIQRDKDRREDIETIDDVKRFIKQHELPVDEEEEKVEEAAESVLRENYLKDQQELFQYLQSEIDVQKIDRSRVHVLDTHTLYNIQILENQSLRLFMNLHMLNDIRYLNQYFLQVHAKLKTGGFFILRKRRLENYRERLEGKYPHYIATGLYILHFLWHRAAPKLPLVGRIYFMITKGRNRVITRAELIGRLYFCGFKLIDFARIGDSHWFIAQKLKTPVVEANPTYGPFIKLPRVGYGGELIHIYKFRTMHPYAEFLQEYVYEINDLDETGKFNRDFRLTQWGKVLRKYWLDELPQLYNYIKGDLRLLGVRALSQHYFNLYPKDLQEMRIKYKPGLVPPYYADMPDSFEEIVESERRYLQQKSLAPFRTDVVYFSKAFYNIIFKKAHSK